MKIKDLKIIVKKDIDEKLQNQIKQFQNRLEKVSDKLRCVKKEIETVENILSKKEVKLKDASLINIPFLHYGLEYKDITEIDHEILDSDYANVVAYFYEKIIITGASSLVQFYEDEKHPNSYSKGKYVFALTACYLSDYLDWLKSIITDKKNLKILSKSPLVKKQPNLKNNMDFQNLFRLRENGESWYTSLIRLLNKWRMIDDQLKWIEDSSQEFICIFWALRQLNYNSTTFLKTVDKKEYTDLVYSHFQIDINNRGWGKDAFRRNDRHNNKVKEQIPSFIKKLESDLLKIKPTNC